MKVRKVLSVFLVASLSLIQLAQADQSLVHAANESEYSYNISVSPASMLFLGLFNAGVDFKISRKSTLGLEAAFSTIGSSGSSLTAFGGGLRYSYYLTGEALTDSWYVSPYFFALPITTSGSSSSSTVTPMLLGAVAGYHWIYKNGFNMMFGAGAQYATVAKTGGYAVLPALEYRIGFTF
jgi:hypothetical protein